MCVCVCVVSGSDKKLRRQMSVGQLVTIIVVDAAADETASGRDASQSISGGHCPSRDVTSRDRHMMKSSAD